MFYVTIAANMKPGAGYYVVHADEYHIARKLCCDNLDNKWSFIYDTLEKVHIYDRTKWGDIYPNGIIKVAYRKGIEFSRRRVFFTHPLLIQHFFDNFLS